MIHFDFLFSTLAQQMSHGQLGGTQMSGVSLLGLAILGATALLGFVVQRRMMHHMRTYSLTPAPMTGREAAERMLRDEGVSGVKIISTPGMLSDHYNPSNRTVNLSEAVYSEASVAAMAVATHECGHAIQHAKAYPWLGMRSSLVPMVNIGSRLGQIVLMVGLVLAAMGSGTVVAWLGLGLFSLTTVFALVTLPVEFDASRRALAWLERSGSMGYEMRGEAGTALRWAAMTYVSAALSSMAMLLYYAMMLLGRSGNDRE